MGRDLGRETLPQRWKFTDHQLGNSEMQMGLFQ